jgi:hypothetical protein
MTWFVTIVFCAFRIFITFEPQPELLENIFKAFAHIWIGITFARAYWGKERSFWIDTGLLTAVEVACFTASKL